MDIEREATHALSAYQDILPLNPRTIKRIINAINVRQNICMIERNYQSLDIIVRWVVIEQCYPALVDTLRDSPEQVSMLISTKPVVTESTPSIIIDCLNVTELKGLLADKNSDEKSYELIFTPELIQQMS